MYFEKKRPIQNRFNRCHSGIKTFDMAHLQNPFVPPGRFEKRIRLRQIHSHGLLDQHVQPAFEQLATHLGVRYGRYRYAYGFGKLADFIKAAQSLSLKLRSDSFRPLLISVIDPNELGTFQLAIHARMVAPKFSRSHYGGADFPRFSFSAAHSLFIPPVALFGSAAAAGANA
jgi:hypothetical protein